MTYEEAVKRNLRNEADAKLIPYMEQIAAEHEELDFENDGELIDTAAEKMLIADMENAPISTDEALDLAWEEEANSPQRTAELKKIQAQMKLEMELRGIAPLPRDDLLNLILNTPEDEPQNTAPKLDPKIASESLTRMAESLKREKCFHDVHYFTSNRFWNAIVRFTDGELSSDAQTTLIQMKHNAHRTMLNQNGDLKVITFIVTG